MLRRNCGSFGMVVTLTAYHDQAFFRRQDVPGMIAGDILDLLRQNSAHISVRNPMMVADHELPRRVA
jgi:hypothetical protein